jgi:hypothetical protein
MIDNLQPVREHLLIEIDALIADDVVDEKRPAIIFTLHHLAVQQGILKEFLVK